MDRKELVDDIWSKVGGGITKTAIGEVVDALSSSVVDALAKDDKVRISGLGTFEAKHHSAKQGRNPRTGAVIQIAAKTTAGFKPFPSTNAAINAAA